MNKPLKEPFEIKNYSFTEVCVKILGAAFAVMLAVIALSMFVS